LRGRGVSRSHLTNGQYRSGLCIGSSRAGVGDTGRLRTTQPLHSRLTRPSGKPMLRQFLSRMNILRHDLRYAVRSLLSTLGFTATAVLTLGLGIGANTAMFTIANALLLRPPPFEHAGQLYWIYDTNE